MKNLFETLKSAFAKINPFSIHRKRTPTLIQMEMVECGAAALGIILGYWGKYLPLTELRVVCGVTRDGSDSGNVMQAAENYGLKSDSYTCQVDELKELTLPLIVFWNFNHFLVVEGYSNTHIYLNDPAMGHRKIKIKDFEEGFTGYVMTFKPTETFVKSGTPQKLWPPLLSRLKGGGIGLSFILGVKILLMLKGFFIPVSIQFFYNNVLVNTSLNTSLILDSGLTYIFIISLIILTLGKTVISKLYSKFTISYSTKFFWHLLNLPVLFFSQRSGGEIAWRFSLNDSIANTLSCDLALGILNIFLILFYLVAIFIYNSPIAILGLITAVLNILLFFLINKSRNNSYMTMLQEYGKSMAYAIGILKSIEPIKSAGNESSAFSNFSGYYAKMTNAGRDINIKNIILVSFPPFTIQLCQVALLAIGTKEIFNGNLSIGAVLAIQALMSNFLSPINDVMNLSNSLQTMKINVQRLDDVLNNQRDLSFEDLNKENESQVFNKLEGYLEFKNVFFGYSKVEPPFIQDLSFQIQPGKRVAIIGPVGSGKTTISRLACGLYQPWSGEILYDGKTQSEISPRIVKNSLSLIDQNLFFFEGTIKENLTYWDELTPEDDLIQASKDACIHNVVTARNQGYEMKLNEGGSVFSGGQKQRLEIARGLVKNPSILVMDEITSALDTATEKEVSLNIRRRGCSCLIFAQRLSTIQDCDEIIVINQGCVLQRGTHDDLIKVPGPYKNLVISESIG